MVKTVTAALLLAGCSAKTIFIDSACQSFAVIYPSRRDTAETKRQVLAHNRIYEQQCAEERK